MVGNEYRLLAEAVPQLIWVTDADGRIEYFNQKFVEYTGFSLEALPGPTAWCKVLHPDDLERCLGPWITGRTTKNEYETEYRLRRASDASWRWHLTRAVPVKDREGRVLKWIGTCTDIEDQKRVLDALRATEQRILDENRRKDEFLAMLGHELRNPLAPILGAVNILKHRGPDQRAIDIIERQTRHLARLVDDLLEVSRISRGRVELHKEPREIATFVDHAVEGTMPLIEERGHTLRVDVAREGLLVDADPVRFAQVLANLLDNASKYTDRGGIVTVRARSVGHEVVVSVSDTDVGIPAETLPHVFDLFVQGARPLDRGQGGLGIGLTLVRSLVEMHGGSVAASSGGPGRGSEFVVRMPRIGDGSVAPAPDLATPPVETVRGTRVLVVDDNADVTVLLTDFLTWKGYVVESAGDGLSGLRAVHAFRPDVVLLDIGLPAMNGLDVAREIRRDPRLAGTRVIALTGYGQLTDRERSRSAGFERHLVKPIDFEQLVAILEAPPAPRGAAPRGTAHPSYSSV